MNHVWRSRNISANLLPFLFTVFTCTVSLKARAACSPCSVVCFDLFRVNSFHPSPCAWTPDTWWEETKGRRLCTDPLNIWPCLRILCGIWCCCNAVWPQHGKKKPMLAIFNELPLNSWKPAIIQRANKSIQRCGHFSWTMTSLIKKVHRALILWPCCFQSVALMWRALASPRHSSFFVLKNSWWNFSQLRQLARKRQESQRLRQQYCWYRTGSALPEAQNRWLADTKR